VATSGSALKPGDTLGPYQLLVPIGVGGMGRVWVAREPGALTRQRLVAIKTAISEDAATEGYWKVLLDEARIASVIQHPNVCAIHALERERGIVYLVMDYSDGGSLRELLDLAPEKRLEPGMAARIVARVCSGLDAAHELVGEDGEGMGVVHRDVSPQNILISSVGEVKITDFGVAKARGQVHAPTQTGEVKGKLSYMAPEQVTTKDVDRRADIFALGCVLYEASTGERPFHGEDALATLYQLLEQPVTPPSQRLEGYPPGLEAIVLRALAREPGDRYQTCEEMGRDLEAWLSSERLMITDADVAKVVQSEMGERIRTRLTNIDAAVTAIENGVSIEIEEPQQLGTLSGTAGSVPEPIVAPPPQKRPRWIPWAAAAALLGVALAFVVRRPAEPPVTRELERSAVSSPTAAPPPAQSQKLILTLRAQPSHAVLFLDDGPALPNPYQLEVIPDSQRHRLRAVAEGYVEQTQDLWYDRSKEISVALPKAQAPVEEPVAANGKKPPRANTGVRPARPGPDPGQPTSANPQRPGDLPTINKRPPRQIDVDNPFGSQ
jgi:eukaryotic-like serine/threonine-protein kinase